MSAEGNTPRQHESANAHLEEVQRLRSVLDGGASSSPSALLRALAALKALGPLSKEVLSASLIGKSVNCLAKTSPDEVVRAKAQELVEGLRQAYRKRGLEEGRRGEDSVKTKLPRLLPGETAESSEKKVKGDVECSQAAGHAVGLKSAAELSDKLDVQRSKVRNKLAEALRKCLSICYKAGRLRDPTPLADEIERELHTQLGASDYLRQARSVLFNLNDLKNTNFSANLLLGLRLPFEVPSLTAEAMASEAKVREREQVRRDAMEAIETDWEAKHSGGQSDGMIPCGKCGSTKTVYNQMQSGWGLDEPLTTYVTCLACKHRWKFDDLGASDDVDGTGT